MKDTIRTFIAVKITPERKLLELFARLKLALESENIKWVDIDNLHITLRFLGETKKEQVPEIVKILDKIARNYQPFQFNLSKVGYFKSKNHPRVLFINTGNNLILKKLAGEIENEIAPLGFVSEDRIFKPHLTLARIKFVRIRNAFYSLIDGLQEDDIQMVEVSEIIFYESILSSSGPKYNPIKKIKLSTLSDL